MRVLTGIDARVWLLTGLAALAVPTGAVGLAAGTQRGEETQAERAWPSGSLHPSIEGSRRRAAVQHGPAGPPPGAAYISMNGMGGTMPLRRAYTVSAPR
jgi:hypothetical protein